MPLGDDLGLLRTYYPLLHQASIFLLGYQKVGSDGLPHAVANAHETQWAVQDPTTDLAADHALFAATISAAQLLNTDGSLQSQLTTAEGRSRYTPAPTPPATRCRPLRRLLRDRHPRVLLSTDAGGCVVKSVKDDRSYCREEVPLMARRSMREEIVEAAVEQFHMHGFNAAGVKDITDSAGAPKGSFYNHFASKEALAVVALERYGESRPLRELTDASVDPLLRLRQHFEFLRDENTSRDFTRGCLLGGFGNEMADHSDLIREAVRHGLGTWAQAITVAIAEAQESGRVATATDAKSLAWFILNAWEGTLISARSEHSEDSYKVFFDLVFGTLLV